MLTTADNVDIKKIKVVIWDLDNTFWDSNQFVQIIQAENGEQTQDSPDTVMQWKQSFGSYTHNEGDEVSQAQNLCNHIRCRTIDM